MADLIKLKRSSVAAKVPLTTDLELGELAINTYDGKLYLKKDNGTESIVEISNGTGSGINNIVEDTTPQLGGQLDLNGQSITDEADNTINLVKDTHIEATDGLTEFRLKTGATGSKCQMNFDKQSGADVMRIRYDVATDLASWRFRANNVKFYNDYADQDIEIGTKGTGAIKFSNATSGSSYRIPTSDGTAGTVLVTDGAGNLSFSNQRVIDSSDVFVPEYQDHRYWRIKVDGATTYVSLNNLELRTSDGIDQSGAGGTITASSENPSFPASNLIDDNTNTWWHSATGVTSNITLDFDFGFGASQQIETVLLSGDTNSLTSPDNVYVYWSDDGITWVEYTYFINISWTSFETKTFDLVADLIAVNDILSWDGYRWINQAPGSNTIAVNDLSDTTISAPVENEVLFYNGTDWINGKVPVNPVNSVFVGNNTTTLVSTLLSGNNITEPNTFAQVSGSSNVTTIDYTTTAQMDAITALSGEIFWEYEVSINVASWYDQSTITLNNCLNAGGSYMIEGTAPSWFNVNTGVLTTVRPSSGQTLYIVKVTHYPWSDPFITFKELNS